LIQSIGAVGQTMSYSYDTNSNLTQVADPLGHVTSAAYDALNRVIKTTDAIGGMTAFAYDHESRLAGVTDPRGLTTSYVHDGLDDLTSINSPDSGVSANTYDAAGNLVSSTDARGDTTTYTYDALNRVTKAAFADSTSIVYQYDQGANGIGRRTSMTDAGGTTTWVYDVHGRVISKQQTTGGVALTTSRTYNAVTGQLASITYPSGSTTFYSHDATGRVSAITYQPPGGATSSLLSQIAYRPFGGPAASWKLGNGGAYGRAFDQDGRIAGLVLPTSGTAALAYDAASRITGIAETGLTAKTFGYDALGRLTNYTGGALTQTYAYDANGNRTGFTAPSVALTYNYAAASNRLTGISGSETDSFTYDANGNMLTHNSPAADYTYTYNARNRRAQTLLGANATTDVINGLGQRTVQTVVSSELFVYDEAGHLTGSYNGNGSVIAETVWLDDLPVAVLEPAGPFYIAPDHLGAPHQITDGSINAVWLWDHDPFGNGTPSGTFSFNLRFPGQVYDQNAKLHYNNFRDYDPNAGRYIESDPIGLRSGINTYAYVDANPVRLIDPRGLCPPTDCEKLAEKIEQVRDELAKRADELTENQYNLPPTGPMSIGGHQQQFRNKQTQLRNLLNDFNSNNCGGGSPIPIDAWQYATRPTPAPAPAQSQGLDANSVVDGVLTVLVVVGTVTVTVVVVTNPEVLAIPFPGNPVYGGL